MPKISVSRPPPGKLVAPAMGPNLCLKRGNVIDMIVCLHDAPHKSQIPIFEKRQIQNAAESFPDP